ncbi:hypothetical protein KUTeg_015914 [Tegillarca granosa]|uniref:Ig-like domain-containing protein n=1 Tax=Tegillarca granosa TaxID=220873 RepID=A0ABQ9EKJ9_TEGGR|nr:hypothetical protein KUTeg_015914 [Tegillarca granosa]
MLRIIAVDRTDQGVYVCRATNDAGTRETTAELIVTPQTLPAFRNRESEVNTVEGGDSVLICDPDADPSIQYRWIKDGVSLRTGSKYTLQGNRMIVRNVVHGDEGRYECYPENTVGFSRNVVTLHVLRSRGGIRIRDGDRFVEEAVRQARNQVNAAVNQTLTGLFDRSREHTVQDLISIFRYPSADTLELARAEEIFEQTLELIYRHVKEGHQYNVTGHDNSYKEIVSPGHLELIANMSGCLANIRITRCSNMCYHKRYRSMDGACNNLEGRERQTWGASVIAFDRLLPPIYENGFNAPVGNDIN